MGRAHKQISSERKERLKPVLNDDIRTMYIKETSDSKYCFGENLLKSMKEAKESFRISYSLVSKFQKINHQSGCKRSFGYTNIAAGARFSAFHSLNFQDRKTNQWHRGQSSSSTKYATNTPSMKLTLSRWGGYPPRSFNQSAPTRRAQLSVAAKAVRSTDLPNHHVKTWVNNDKTR